MSKRTVFTTISPLPTGIPREVVVNFLHNHLEMIDLNPLVKERHPIKPPADAPADEIKCIWYSLTDRITYLPGGLASGDISYTCAFHDLPDGIQTHCRAPLNVDIRDKWTLCGTLPGEPAGPVELGIGAPATGLYIREDVDLRCNILMTGFVKKNLKKSHATLVDHLVEKARQVMSGDKDSIYTGKSPSSAAEEKPVLFPTSQATQNQPPRYDVRENTLGTRRSPPPQLGSPFVSGYQPGRPPSMRYPSSNEGDKSRNATLIAHHRPHSQFTNPPSRLEQHYPAAARHPPTLAHLSTRPHPPQHYSLPPPAHHDHTLYPQPLRVRNLSIGSAQVTQPIPGTARPAACHRSSGSTSSSSAATTSRPSVSEPRTSSDHPEYPSLNPYSDAGSGASSSPDEPRPPRTPPYFAELAGSGPDLGKKAGADGAWSPDHPVVLRPGGRAGMGARLDSPFIAELE
ncbi:hypothetical protein N8I77_000548 [Diaporthe amygdali]|uniref:DUF7053 domain-containing protein n=1 Tax=Phomopsis amygdali TaxID=1214568 RepID=A0AAD9SPY6_PHOAM|nr:hypothetical protein N8I77_000548 [Diaporthe amygdali]